MTYSRQLGHLLQVGYLGIIGVLTVVSCGGIGSSKGKDSAWDSGTIDGGDARAGATNVSVASATLDLGVVMVGKTSSAPTEITVTNLGGDVSLAPSIASGPFILVGTTCDALAASPAKCTISVSFAPTAEGVAIGILAVTDTTLVGLTGTGIAPANFSVISVPDKVDLGVVAMGTIASGRVKVTAITALTDLVCSVSVDGNVVPDPTLDGTCTATMAAGASCVVGFSFTSTSLGVKLSDWVACSAGGLSKTTFITATVVTAATPKIWPSAGSVSATTGSSADVVFTVANGGGVSSGPLTAAITPANPEFAIAATTCVPGIAPLGTCTVTVVFKPTTAGTKTATLVVTESSTPTTATSAAIVGFSDGEGVQMTITGPADFGSVAVGSTGAEVQFTVKNMGGDAAAGLTVATTDSQFIIGNDTCTGQTLVATTGSCTFTVTFSPAATAPLGVMSALITISSTGGNPFSLPIKGTAVQSPP